MNILGIRLTLLSAAVLSSIFTVFSAQGSISLDRTRVVFDGSRKSMSLNIKNNNPTVPYLAQAWIEDENGQKIVKPFIVLPPIQRLEPKAQSQLKIQKMSDISKLPTDRETLFYFNLREIPPRSEKPNVLQLALQTRVKLFYRPAALFEASQASESPWQERLTLEKRGNQLVVSNPTPYYITLVDAKQHQDSESLKQFEPLMVAPKGESPLSVTAAQLGQSPVLTYVGDYGGHRPLTMQCDAQQCRVVVK